MIRLLDRYVLSIFLSALAVFTLAFVFLFVTVDFAMNIRKFLDLESLQLFVVALRLLVALGVLDCDCRLVGEELDAGTLGVGEVM